MKQKKIFLRMIAFVLILVCMTSLTGCVGIDQENKTEVELSEDGSITQVIVDDVGTEVTGEELEDYINTYINEFQEANGGEAVALEKCMVGGGKVNITLKYSSANAYAVFNNVTCFNGTVKEAYDAGFDMNRTFKTVDGKTIPYFELVRNSYDCKVLILEEPVTVSLPGEIYIISDGVTVDDNGTINVDDDNSDEEYITTTSQPVFLIYKTSK